MQHSAQYPNPASQLLTEIRILISDTKKYENLIIQSIAKKKIIDPIPIYNQIVNTVQHCQTMIQELQANIASAYDQVKDETEKKEIAEGLKLATLQLQDEYQEIQKYEIEMKVRMHDVIQQFTDLQSKP